MRDYNFCVPIMQSKVESLYRFTSMLDISQHKNGTLEGFERGIGKAHRSMVEPGS